MQHDEGDGEGQRELAKSRCRDRPLLAGTVVVFVAQQQQRVAPRLVTVCLCGLQERFDPAVKLPPARLSPPHRQLQAL